MQGLENHYFFKSLRNFKTLRLFETIRVTIYTPPYVCNFVKLLKKTAPINNTIRYNSPISLRVSVGGLYKLDNCSIGLYNFFLHYITFIKVK